MDSVRSARGIVFALAVVALAATTYSYLSSGSGTELELSLLSDEGNPSSWQLVTVDKVAEGNLAFQPGVIADIVGKDIESATAYTYTASDGTAAQYLLTHYRSAAQASREFQRLKSKAVDATPDVTGPVSCGKPERTLIRYREAGGPRAAVVWIDGPKLNRIEAESLEHALTLEKLNYSGQSCE